jgi:hypothetical protein
MADETQLGGVKIVVPVNTVNTTTQLTATTRANGEVFLPIAIEWAPAWFYSALAWLGQSYRDASNTQRSFSNYLAGANVDPYRQLGSTRLFLIEFMRNEFFLSIAPDPDSEAPLSGENVTYYQRTDAGILQMYKDLSASNIFPCVTHCYVPGEVDLAPSLEDQLAEKTVGYDPASGLRRILLGSAIAQVVPIGDFAQVENEQIYDPTPAIVPLATSLVYDVTTNNSIGAKSFVLPVAYIVDQATPGQFAVNRFGATQAPPQGQQQPSFDYGETAIFQGGPGYDATKATQLTFKLSTELIQGGAAFITTFFQDSTAYTDISTGTSVVTGVSALTCTALFPLATFTNQNIAGFYRDNTWGTSLGFPIFDYKTSNSDFTIENTAGAIEPELVYDPSAPFLNGGNLPNVLAKFAAATYILSPDTLQTMIANAGDYSAAGVAAGLSVMTAALKFDMSSKPSAGITDQLTVPVTATATTTPETTSTSTAAAASAAGSSPRQAAAAPAAPTVTHGPVSNAVVGRPPVGIISRLPVGPIQLPVGQSGNTPTGAPASPSSVQVELNAFIPIEALLGTGIISIPIGTDFFLQPLGDGAQFQANPPGTVFNLCDAHRDTYALQPVDLAIADTGLSLTTGIQYVLSLSGTALAARGSDGSTLSATPKLAEPDAQHTYVGALVYEAGLTSVRLYPILSLTLPAPAVGSNGIEQGESYAVSLTYGAKQSTIDILDSNQVAVATGLAVASPTPTDNSKPQVGDLYFGSVLGGAASIAVWAVPVFLPVTPDALPDASFNGSMTLGTVSSGLPSYALKITDSSLFIFTNINVDTSEAGSASSSNVFAAGIAINSAPDDLSSKAFTPTQFILGLVRQAQVGPDDKFVFVPETDSVVIGGKRYMLSIIELDTLTDDPTQRPYPPNFWPDSRYWQFANRHNPYLDIRYEGQTEDDRIAQAQADTQAIAQKMQGAQEPLQMYLDTQGMVVWPILGFPFDAPSQSIDRNQLGNLASAIISLLASQIPAAPAAGQGVSASQQVVLPGAATQLNPYTYGVDFTSGDAAASSASSSGGVSAASGTAVSAINGIVVQNFGSAIGSTAPSLDQALRVASLQTQQAAANLADIKQAGPQVEIMQQNSATTSQASLTSPVLEAARPQVVYGFSVYNATSGECYLIELVPNDLNIPDQLPNPTQNATYDPYYVRVVFLQRLKAYNMSIIVPSIAYDQYGHLAEPDQESPYTNLVAKTDDFAIGYMSSLYDLNNRFDSLNFEFVIAADQDSVGAARTYVCTNIPYYSIASTVRISIALFRPITFACRRQNWNATCTLMVATIPENTHVYLAFGGGDLPPCGSTWHSPSIQASPRTCTT